MLPDELDNVTKQNCWTGHRVCIICWCLQVGKERCCGSLFAHSMALMDSAAQTHPRTVTTGAHLGIQAVVVSLAGPALVLASSSS